MESRTNKLLAIKNHLENHNTIELRQKIYSIIHSHQERYTNTKTHILINLSWVCDECIDEIYTLVSTL